ncbi:TPA: DNA-binding response regulator [candidate division WWE3 bacterium]|uniref:DNA-binding response regulator n=4 Tax=Katanobacteria TaxID=422282 RepID=A0A0G1KLX6_UNCKA|nr:MAG: DNA-binding response regulator [candidate division WWE3 bacterium GW2011_GWA2_44_16]KKT69521.1 MAG: DNA-binding response regulator [candidate division WWE3 bacterium GW2011_GWB1_44_4]KKT84505.1 MAG: DNA-binding response regulator [candidate division WWE3 bacterium GW2011_GWC2_44_9]HAZ29504.1 DNA-binding response regulator [candidate division WWE3 bacterium]
MRLLVVEDERDLAENLKKGLTEQGYAVDIALDGEEGCFMAETEPYDLIILDLMLPKMDGIAICNSLRKKGLNIPVLMLTAKSRIEDKVEGFNTGADDYLTKPFSMTELYVRVKALLKRRDKIELPVLEVGNLKIDLFKHKVYRANEAIELTPKEFSILELLAKNKNGVVTRTMILDHVWDTSYTGDSNIVDVLVGTLRKKIDLPGKGKLIQTVYGVGFKLAAKE